MKDRKHRAVRDHCHYRGQYRGAPHSICNIKYRVPVPKQNSIAFHYGSNYHYDFITK